MVCYLCWENPKVQLIDCIISTFKHNPSNCKGHFRTNHDPSETPGLCSDVSTITPNSNSDSTKVKKVDKQTSILSYQQDPADIPTPQIALSHLYKFFNDANVAIMQSNNEHLSNFIKYLLTNAQQLRLKQSECLFSRYKYMNQRDDRFLKFVSSLKELVQYSRNYYEEKFCKNIPYIFVSHDGWDSKDHDILGVCVHFIVPGYWKVINLAAGLKRIRSKKSVATAQAIHIILERYVYIYMHNILFEYTNIIYYL